MTSQILKGIDEIIKNMTFPYDKTFPSVSYGKDETGKYKVVFEGRLRSIASSLPDDIAPGALVWVKIPSGKLKDMHICGLRRKEK